MPVCSFPCRRRLTGAALDNSPGSTVLVSGTGVPVGARTASTQNMKQDLHQKFAAVKESVAKNQAALSPYSWTEHTDKTPIGKPAPKKEMRGMKKKVAEKKIGELQTTWSGRQH